jgi:hypothetical protein
MFETGAPRIGWKILRDWYALLYPARTHSHKKKNTPILSLSLRVCLCIYLYLLSIYTRSLCSRMNVFLFGSMGADTSRLFPPERPSPAKLARNRNIPYHLFCLLRPGAVLLPSRRPVCCQL